MHYSDTLAETIQRRYPDPDQYPYCSWCYAQGFMLWGFIRLYERTQNQKYYDYVLQYCEEHVKEDGEVLGFTGISLDDIMAGSVLVWAYTQTKKEKYRLACDRIRRAYDDYPRNPDGGFWHSRPRSGEMWVDGLFMGLMFLTRYGKYIGDSEFCFSETVKQLSIVFDRCEKDSTGLLYHAYSANPDVLWAHPITGCSPEIWSEGLGWYAMILVEVLELLPKDYPGCGRLLMQLTKLVDSLIKVQDPASGLWYQVVDKPHHRHNFHDTSGSAMFLYTIKKALLLGLIEQKPEILRAVKLGFAGIKTKYRIDPEGNVDIYDACNGLCVQVDYDTYVEYARNVNCQEAVAAVLWATGIMEYGI